MRLVEAFKDTISGIRSWFEIEDARDEEAFRGLTIRHRQDIEPTLALCAEKRKLYDRPSFRASDPMAINEGAHYAFHIPEVVVWDLQRRGVLNDEDRFRHWLNTEGQCFALIPNLKV